MPSTKNPNLIVNAGPGRLPADSVPASALLFVSGGGGDAALTAHITDPVDAHMATAIGIHPTYAATGQPLLSSAGGPYDGENVEDALAQLAALLPTKPNSIGFDGSTPNSGTPDWGTLASQRVGGWSNATDMVFSKYLVPNSSATFVLSGMVYPADRGVIAIYKNTDGDFFNAAATTLVACLWLGANPPPTGMSGAGFVEADRATGQTDYVATNAGLDQISLTFRLPYAASYGSGVPYIPYSVNFPAYQLATYTVQAQALAAGDAGSFLVVHWRETYATTLASIQPASLTLATLVAANCYSAVPTAGDFDGANISAVNRKFVFRDTTSGSAPSGASFTSVQNGTPSTTTLSGVQFYSNSGTTLTWNVTVTANNLFDNCYLTGSVANPPLVPTGYNSSSDPMRVNFSDFGGSALAVPYYDLRKSGTGTNYSEAAAPQVGDVAEYVNASLSIVSPSSAAPTGGFGQLKMELRDAFNTVTYTDPLKYLFNSYTSGAISTATYEPFVDEHYRYVSAKGTGGDPLAAGDTIVPVGGDAYSSTTVITTGTNDAQVLGNRLVYPKTDFSSGFRPAAQPNYAAVLAADSVGLLRRYVRAFDTGVARNTGRIRIRGVGLSAFASTGAYTGNPVTDHPGGAIIELAVPGATGWLDLGRPLGDPDLTTADGRGCQTTTLTSGSDLYVSFNTQSFTTDNGSGEFPLFIRITLIKGGGGGGAPGAALEIDEVEWLAP